MKSYTRWSLIIIAISFSVVFVSYGIRFSYPILMPEMITSLGLSKTESGLVFSLYMIGYAVFSPIAGFLADRLGGRVVIPSFCLIMAAGTFLMSISQTSLMTYTFFFIAGSGAAATWVPIVALVQKWFRAEHRGRVLGFVEVGIGGGYGSMGLILPTIVQNYGWRFGWIILSIAAFLVAILAGILIRNRSEDVVSTRASQVGADGTDVHAIKGISTDYAEILFNRNFWLILSSYVSMSLSGFVFMTFLVTYTNTELKIPYETASFLMTILAIGGICGALTLPNLSDIMSRRNVLMICSCVVAISTIGLVTNTWSLALIMIFAFVYGVFYESVFPIYAACAADFFPSSIAGLVVGLWTFAYGMAGLISPIIGGYLADVCNTFFWSFVLSALFSLGSLILLVPLAGKQALSAQ
jgi:sugar phosphate permease